MALSSVLLLTGCSTKPETIDPIPLIDVSAAERVSCDDPQPMFSSSNRDLESLDAKIVADQEGVSLEEIGAGRAFRDAFKEYAWSIREKYSGEISGSWAEPTPEQKGYIVFVDEVPDAVRSEIDCGQKLNPENVILVPGGQISDGDQEPRQDLASQAIQELDYRLQTLSTDHETGLIRAQIYVEYGGETPSATKIAAKMSQLIEQGDAGLKGGLTGRAAEILPTDLALDVEEGIEPQNASEGSPLATWDTSSSGAFWSLGFEHRRLDITDHCVYGFAASKYERVLMVFPADASWNSGLETIELQYRDQAVVTLQNGDMVSYGAYPREEADAEEPQYAIRPHPSCDTEIVYTVWDVRLAKE